MPSNTSWRTTAIACALLGCALSVAARLAVGPPGAYVHVEWQPTVDEATQAQVAERYRLDKPEKLKDPYSWRFDLIDTSSNNIRALVADPAVRDTHEIDRHAFTLEPTAPRTARRSRMATGGDEIVRTADGLAIELLVLAILVALARTTITRLVTRGIPELDASAAGLFRIVFGSAVLAFFTYQRVDASWLAATFDLEVEGRFHAAIIDSLRGHPVIVDLLTPWLLLTVVAFTAGLFTRWTYALFVLGALVRAFVAVSIDSTHPQSTLVLTLVALLPSRWGDAFSIDAWRHRTRGGDPATPASRHYGYSAWVSGLVIGVAWAAAAWAKLSVPPGWTDWVLNGTVKYHFVTDSVGAPLQWGLQFARHPLLAILASFGVIALEAVVITGAFVRNEWYRLAMGAGVMALFSGFYLFMGVFWPAWWILMLGFLPWQRLLRAVRPAHGAHARSAGPAVAPVAAHWGGRLAVAQSLVVLAILTQQVVVSALKLDQAPMFSWYDMYSATYRSPADWAASRPPRYRIVVSTAQGRSELPRCNPHSEFVREFEAALKGSADARTDVWRELRGCGQDLTGVRDVALEGDVQTFDWERLVFESRPAATLGPLENVTPP